MSWSFWKGFGRFLTRREKRVIGLDEREQRWLLEEYSYLEELRRDLEKKDIEAARRIVRKIAKLEVKLERLHKTVLRCVEDLKEESLTGMAAKEFSSVEQAIEVIERDLSRRIRELKKSVDEKLGWTGIGEEAKLREIEKEVIRAIESEINQWIALNKKLLNIEKALVAGQELEGIYPHPKTASQEKILHLLRGDGEYKGYGKERRMVLWNRWARITTQRVIKNANLEGVDLGQIKKTVFGIPQKIEGKVFNFEGFVFAGRANFKGANLEGVNFIRAQLVGADFTRAKMEDAVFIGANLRNAIFVDANHGYDLNESLVIRFDGADLTDANLSHANLRSSSFRGAILDGANLSEVFIKQGDFGGARFENTNFNDATIEEGFFGGAHNLTAKQLLTLGFNTRRLKGLSPVIIQDLIEEHRYIVDEDEMKSVEVYDKYYKKSTILSPGS